MYFFETKLPLSVRDVFLNMFTFICLIIFRMFLTILPMRYSWLYPCFILILLGCGSVENDAEKEIHYDSKNYNDELIFKKQENESYVEDFALFRKFIPEGYEVLDFKKGDLNLDNYEDAILILRKVDEKDIFPADFDDPPRRPLFILTGKEGGGFEVAHRNDHVVLCYQCGGMIGDPYYRVEISNGVFSVLHTGGSSWRWNRTITFMYNSQLDDWVLYKDMHEMYHHQQDNMEREVLASFDKDSLTFSDYNGIEIINRAKLEGYNSF